MTEAPRAPRRVLLHLEPGLRVPVEPDEVFLLEADGDETRVRTRAGGGSATSGRSARSWPAFPPGSSSRCTVRPPSTSTGSKKVRLRENGRDWELRLEPPVNRMVPIGRTRLAALWAAYGDGAPRPAGFPPGACFSSSP